MKLGMLSVFGLTLAHGAAFAQDEQPAGGGGDQTPAGGDQKPAGGGDMAPAGGEAGGMYTKDTWPSQVTLRPLTLAKGMIEIRGNTFYASLSTDAVFKPFGLAPAVAYGIDDKMQIQLFLLNGLCLAGDTNGCFKVFNDIGADFAFNVMPQGEFNLAVHGGILIPNFADPPGLFLDLYVAALGRYRIGQQMAIVFDPTVRIGLTKRDFGNKETLAIPVWFQFQATPVLNVFLTTTFGGPLDGFGDFFTGSLGVGATYNINKMLDVGLEFDFANLYGKGGGADARELFLRLAVRL